MINTDTYGPYGVAAGRRGNGERCIYAWQWIEDAGNVSGAPRNPALAAFYGQAPVSVRVRLCRSGVSADALAGLMNDLAIGGVARTQAVGAGLDVLTPAGGAAPKFNGYQLPRAAALEPTVAESRPTRRARRQAPVVHRRRARAAQAVYQQAYPAEPQAAYPQPYPVAPQAAYPQPYPAAAPAYAPPAYAPPPQAPRPLDQSLPPQAYQGPQGAPRAPASSQPPGATQYNTPPAARLQRDPIAPPPRGASI